MGDTALPEGGEGRSGVVARARGGADSGGLVAPSTVRLSDVSPFAVGEADWEAWTVPLFVNLRGTTKHARLASAFADHAFAIGHT